MTNSITTQTQDTGKNWLTAVTSFIRRWPFNTVLFDLCFMDVNLLSWVQKQKGIIWPWNGRSTVFSSSHRKGRRPINMDVVLAVEDSLTRAQKFTLSLLGRSAQLQTLYDSSIHTFSNQVFHNRCNYQGPTITWVEAASGNVFGGVTNSSWTSGGPRTSHHWFLESQILVNTTFWFGRLILQLQTLAFFVTLTMVLHLVMDTTCTWTWMLARTTLILRLVPSPSGPLEPLPLLSSLILPLTMHHLAGISEGLWFSRFWLFHFICPDLWSTYEPSTLKILMLTSLGQLSAAQISTNGWVKILERREFFLLELGVQAKVHWLTLFYQH